MYLGDQRQRYKRNKRLVPHPLSVMDPQPAYAAYGTQGSFDAVRRLVYAPPFRFNQVFRSTAPDIPRLPFY
jgi:hypothetical protein